MRSTAHRPVERAAAARRTRFVVVGRYARRERTGRRRATSRLRRVERRAVVRGRGRDHQRVELVIAVGAARRCTSQRQRHLGVRAHDASFRHRSRPAPSRRESASRLARRIDTRARQHVLGVRAEHRANALRNVLRRVAKPARTSSNIRAGSSTAHRRRGWRTSSTSALSTFGRGTKTVGGTDADHLARRRSTRPSPTPRRTRRRPTVAASRSPTSRCTITSIAVDHRRVSSARDTTGVATLYGRFATIAQRSPPRAAAGQSTVSASACDDLDVAARRRPPRSTGSRCRSSSIASTCAPASDERDA